MAQHVRELLVTTKEAQNWQGQYRQKVDGLMSMLNKMDTDEAVKQAGELLNVYKKTVNSTNVERGNSILDCVDRPFEFLVFRN